jgi:hypothetical protein
LIIVGAKDGYAPGARASNVNFVCQHKTNPDGWITIASTDDPQWDSMWNGDYSAAEEKCSQTAHCTVLHDYKADGKHWRVCKSVTFGGDGKAATVIRHGNRAYVYNGTITNASQWFPQRVLSPVEGDSVWGTSTRCTNFGRAVAISAKFAIIGGKGHAFVYKKTVDALGRASLVFETNLRAIAHTLAAQKKSAARYFEQI